MSYDNFRALSINTVEKLDELANKENGSIIFLVSDHGDQSYTRRLYIDKEYRTFPDDSFQGVSMDISYGISEKYDTVFFKARVLNEDNDPDFLQDGTPWIKPCYAADYGIGNTQCNNHLTFDDINLAKAYQTFCKKNKHSV